MKKFNNSDIYRDIAVSTRVRLARNLKDYPFPGKASKDQEDAVINEVYTALSSNAKQKKFELTKMEGLSGIDAMSLSEKHMISPEFARAKNRRALITSQDKSAAVMVNEEDHIRLQVTGAGLCTEECLKEAQEIDGAIEKSVDYAFDENLGYLTRCPTNLGTGIRVSVMLHLPALTKSGDIRNVIAALGKVGLAVRGIYGEGSSAKGDLYQISNQLTLGATEEEIASRVNDAAVQIIEREKGLRAAVLQSGDRDVVTDRIWRSVGVLRSARSISSDEAASRVSDLRLAVSAGMIKDITFDAIDEMTSKIEPATIESAAGGEISPSERDKKRAELLRSMTRGISLD